MMFSVGSDKSHLSFRVRRRGNRERDYFHPPGAPAVSTSENPIPVSGPVIRQHVRCTRSRNQPFLFAARVPGEKGVFNLNSIAADVEPATVRQARPVAAQSRGEARIFVAREQ